MRSLQWVAGCALIAVVLPACDPGPVGDWRSREFIVTEANRTELTVESDGAGSLTLWNKFDKDLGLVAIEYTIEDWYAEEGGGYEFQFKCSAGCENLTAANIATEFEMDCTHWTDFGHLDCDAKAPWKSYGFFEFEVVPD